MSTQGLLSTNDDDDECFAYIKQNVILQSCKANCTRSRLENIEEPVSIIVKVKESVLSCKETKI